MNGDDLPDVPPAGGPLTREEVLHAISSYWTRYIGATEEEAMERAERAFTHMTVTGWLAEWGFTDDGQVLYEPTTPAATQTIVYVTRRTK